MRTACLLKWLASGNIRLQALPPEHPRNRTRPADADISRPAAAAFLDFASLRCLRQRVRAVAPHFRVAENPRWQLQRYAVAVLRAAAIIGRRSNRVNREPIEFAACRSKALLHHVSFGV